MTATTVCEQLLRAMASKNRGAILGLLTPSAVLRIWDAEGNAAHRPAEFVADALIELGDPWLARNLEIFGNFSGNGSAATDFRVQLRRGADAFDLNGALTARFEGDLVNAIDLYLSRPIPALERIDILRANISEEERLAFVLAFPQRWDMREFFPPNTRLRRNLEMAMTWTNVAHPGSNYIRLTNLPDDTADRRIEEVKDFYRAKGLGIQWTVGQHDQPADLGKRLEQQGFARAGDQALMARFGLDNLDDIPTNPDVEVIDLRKAPHFWEDSLQINATAFQWPHEQTENEREGWFEDLESEPIRSVMALVNGKPVADAHLYLQHGIAYLGGAATLPEFRNQKIYSTLLRRRLERARDEGYEVAFIHAEPMSRRVVSRFGFQTYAMYDVYGWMEPMDLNVIKTLVQDQ